jgi:hypothetical protein
MDLRIDHPETASHNKYANEVPRMYKTGNDIAPHRRADLNSLMNRRLADAVDLQMQQANK